MALHVTVFGSFHHQQDSARVSGSTRSRQGEAGARAQGSPSSNLQAHHDRNVRNVRFDPRGCGAATVAAADAMQSLSLLYGTGRGAVRSAMASLGAVIDTPSRSVARAPPPAPTEQLLAPAQAPAAPKWSSKETVPPLSIAPMMEVTDRHYRALARLMASAHKHPFNTTFSF
jgi:hypothetical protein